LVGATPSASYFFLPTARDASKRGGMRKEFARCLRGEPSRTLLVEAVQ
jgi:hypothetical protein